jgi:integrase
MELTPSPLVGYGEMVIDGNDHPKEIHLNDQLTVRQVLDRYLRRMRMATNAEAEGSLRDNTTRELERFLPRVIEIKMEDGSRLGDLAYCEIRPSDLKAAFTAFRYSPGLPRNGGPGKLPSQATVRNVVAYTRMWMKASDDAMRLDRANPMLAVKTADVVGKRKREPKRYLTDEEVERLLAEINVHYRGITTLLAESGLRSGEARGLLWGDIGEDGFYVTAQANHAGSARVQPKTSTSKRFVAYSTRSRAVIETQRRWVVNTYGPEAVAADRPVFPTKSGRFFDGANLARRVIQAAERAGLPHTSPHSLRHYALKKLQRSGVPLDVVAAVAGHSSTQTTASIYSDPTATPEEKAQAMLRAFG